MADITLKKCKKKNDRKLHSEVAIKITLNFIHNNKPEYYNEIKVSSKS